MPEITPASTETLCQEVEAAIDNAAFAAMSPMTAFSAIANLSAVLRDLLSHARHWQAEAQRLQAERDTEELRRLRAVELVRDSVRHHDLGCDCYAEQWLKRLDRGLLPAALESGR